VAEAPQEPSLFGDFDATREAASEQMEDIFEDEAPAYQPATQMDDDLPPPAYQPQVAAFEPHADHYEDETEAFVAPKAPAPGTPSPEAMLRLRAAASKAPGAARQQPQVQEPRAQEEERPRFGINSLINRMTGSASEPAERSAAPAMRQQPSMHAVQPEPEMDEDQERIEIPAFLRRQAN